MAENPYPPGFEVLRSPGGAQITVVGATLASAATIAPVSLITHVTGVASIATITPPYAEFTGVIFLIADGAWTWTAAGNITVAATTVATVGKAYPFLYDKHLATPKWHPVVVAAAS